MKSPMTGALGALTLLLLATPAQSQEIFASGEVFRDLVVSYPYVLWMQEAATCPGGELAPPCRIRGRTEGGFFPSTLYEASVVNNSIDSFNFELQASSGLIYFLGNNNVLRRPMFSAPSDSVTVVASKASTASGEITLTDTHVWWSENEILYRAPIDGGARQQMYDAPFGTIRELRADAQGGIWFIADAFLSPDTLTRYTSSGGAVFGPAFTNAYALDSTHVYIAVGDGSSERRLRRASLGNLPGHASGAVLHLAGDSSDPEVTTMAIAADDYLYYFKDVAVASQEVIYRLNKFQWASGTPEGVTLQVGSVSDMNVSDNYLYWRQGISNVTRLELSGIVPVQADASLTGMEVTQGVQTLNNTVSLVENKPTVVRVYPQVAGISGVTSVNVTVQLTGTRDGVALTFPPPPQSRRLQNMIADRRDTATSFDFILPYNWRSGTIDLTATISISGIADTNLSNNTVSESGLVFEPKAPICVKYLPVLNTDSLVYRVRNLATGEYNPHWLATYDRTLSVWPSPTIRFYTQTTSLRKPQFLGPAQPFNLNNDADVDHVLAALWEHNVWDDAPGWCSADNARTHYYAMVPDGMVNASVLGKARLGEPLLMVRQVSGGQATFEDPWAGTISAHELRHTYNDLFGTNENYQHVMCDLPAGADFNSFYPYDPNSIGMNGGVLNGGAGWGYDTISNTVIPPDVAWDNGNLAADYMSYCEPGWTSDYSWNLMVDKFPDRAGGKNLEKANRATDVIMVSGRIFADESGGEFFSVFYVPPGLDVEPTASAGTGNTGTVGSYTFDLLNSAGAVLKSHPIFPIIASDQEVNADAFHFHATVSYVPGTTSFRIRKDESLDIATATVSPAAPTVVIDSPTSGSLLAPLTIAWTGNDTDGDTLNYTVQYSADGGASWSAIVTNYEDSYLVVEDGSTLPQSDNAYLRVIASDGFNLGFATAGPFVSPNHPPAPAIVSPSGGTGVSVANVVNFEGHGFDFDEGPLPDSALNWTVQSADGVFDIAIIGRGGALSRLAPGTYTATLNAEDSGGLTGNTTTTFNVATKSVPQGSAPTLDGHCIDTGYNTDSEPLMLEYPNDAPSLARFVRSGNFLYVCFSGMPTLSSPIFENLHLAFDADDSGGTAPLSGDLLIRLNRGGKLDVFEGDAGAFDLDPDAAGIQALPADDGIGTWSAEFRIDLSRLGGWNHLAAVGALHTGSTQSDWPRDLFLSSPETFGQIAFGAQSQSISFPQPPTITVGDTPIAANAVASSGLPVTLTSLTPGVCEIVSNQYITGTAGGLCSIEAAQYGSPAYLPATPVVRSFDVVGVEANAGEPNNTFASATPIVGACPQMTLSRQLDPEGDVDFYLFTGPADLPVTVDIDAAISDSSLNSVLGLFDAAGNLLDFNDDRAAPGEAPSVDSYLRFNMPASGEVTIAVAGFDDYDFDGFGTQGTSTGAYELDIRCSPEPGQLLGTTGSAQNLLLDIDPTTGDGMFRAQLGAFGPINDLAFCNGKLFGAVGGGVSALANIDPLSGAETYHCDVPGDALPALACIEGELHGAWNETFGDSASDLVKIGNPETAVAGGLTLIDEPIEGTTPPVLTFGASPGTVTFARMNVTLTTTAASWGSDFWFEMRHVPTNTTARFGTEGTSCQVFSGCDVDLGWPNTGGVFTADVMVPLNFGGGGQWEVTIQSLWNNSGDIEGIVNASFTVGTQICELTLIGDMGTRVPGLAFDAGNKQLYGCANNGSLLSINKSNGNAVSFPSGSVDNCRAMTASNDASTTIFGGSGANNASMPGLLFTYDPADGTTTPIGENGFDSLSGLAITPADSDRDAVYDTVDNCLNLYNPSQRDTDFDGFGNHCDADIAPGENDCAINFIDLTALKGAFFSSEGSPTWNPDADFNGDGIVNFVDLTILKGQFFGQPGPSGIMPQCLPCVQGDTGFDHAESFGDELFLRGTFNNWAAPPQAKLINQQPGSGRYQARMYFDAGIHEYKMASADWATEYDDPPTTTTPGVAIEYAGGAADSSANIPLDVPTRGCYVFDIEATEPVPAPTPSVIVEMNRFPY